MHNKENDPQLYPEQYQAYRKQFQQIVYVLFFLVAVFFICIYCYFKKGQLFWAAIACIILVLYLIALKLQDKIKWKRDVVKQQIKIATVEQDFLEHNLQPFKDGLEYLTPHHPYTNDLDIFGAGSLYQHLNRTATYIGENTLANDLIAALPETEIRERQQSIQELKGKVVLRQKIEAIGQLVKDDKNAYDQIINWTKHQQPVLHPGIKIAALLFVLFGWFSYTFFIVKTTAFWFNMSTAAFFINNAFLGLQYKKIKRELIVADRIDAILKNYSHILKEIEKENFKSTYLKSLQEKIRFENKTAGEKIKEISGVFNSLNAVNNVFGAAILNGLFLSHIQILNKLLHWKAAHAKILPTWLETIGRIEALNSFANFSFNNPSYTYPVYNKNYKIAFTGLGHPLIDKKKRVTNSVEFMPSNFMILSGSNMSGKSTFLRTVGVNMILAGTGAPVCAIAADLHPLPVYASMRLSDSLVENESYFFAEIKRLQFIKEILDKQVCFVLLDEILRGTNSDDKQNGTIRFIKKMMERKAIGIIATHDLEVCAITTSYPEQLFNKCFEVEIIRNELHFDFRLRDGICKNKSATFLMEKLSVI